MHAHAHVLLTLENIKTHNFDQIQCFLRTPSIKENIINFIKKNQDVVKCVQNVYVFNYLKQPYHYLMVMNNYLLITSGPTSDWAEKLWYKGPGLVTSAFLSGTTEHACFR